MGFFYCNDETRPVSCPAEGLKGIREELGYLKSVMLRPKHLLVQLELRDKKEICLENAGMTSKKQGMLEEVMKLRSSKGNYILMLIDGTNLDISKC
jgi:hypothetical protein